MLLDVKAVLLVGGLGTRLRSVVPSVPKVLATIGRTPFLALLVAQLRSQGINHLVMCTGYRSEQIENEFGDGRAWDIEIQYSKEEQLLGTAGALKQAQHLLGHTPDFIVMNGDSFLEVDFRRLMDFHRSHQALATLAVIRVKDTSRYGKVQVDAGGRVRGFAEKAGSTIPGLVNGGVYIFNHAVFQYFPEQAANLETAVFPRLLAHGVYAAEQRGMFVDIGTPADYAHAQRLCHSLTEAALRTSSSVPLTHD
jgi:D-glycero-alpha-D-manno-heptose 1-phosphate guanylyltransferase